MNAPICALPMMRATPDEGENRRSPFNRHGRPERRTNSFGPDESRPQMRNRRTLFWATA